MKNEQRPLKILPYKAMILLMRLLSIGTLVIIVIFILSLAVPYIKDADSFQYIRKAISIEKSISSHVKNIIPTKIAGKDITRWVIIVAAFFLFTYFNSLKMRCKSKIANLNIMRNYEDWKARVNLSDDAKVLTPLREKLKDLPTGNKKDREDLLKLFTETKRKLDAMGRDLAFLSIDIVDSTGLKEGEDKATIEYNFKEYKNFVANKLLSNGVLKSSWTPDGVMSCFSSVDAAVKAAQEVLNGLEAFNKHVKTIKKDFRVRCGINAGYVYFDESLNLEDMGDRVIDIAGRMQKNAPFNAICIAKTAIEPLQKRSDFVPISKVVDGYEVYVWGKNKVSQE